VFLVEAAGKALEEDVFIASAFCRRGHDARGGAFVLSHGVTHPVRISILLLHTIPCHFVVEFNRIRASS